jgi:hypothetical protein
MIRQRTPIPFLAVAALAEQPAALYLEQRDQNASHLMVFASGRASLLAR